MPKYIEMEADVVIRSDGWLSAEPVGEEQSGQEREMPENSGQ